VRCSSVGQFLGCCKLAFHDGQEVGVGGNDVAGLQWACLRLAIAGEATGLADEQNPSGQIPGLEPPFPEDVKASRGHIGKFKGGSTQPADADALSLQNGNLGTILCLALAAAMGNAATQ